ncbi:MAG: XdhC family protein [Phycisphaerae bacterium]
MSVAEVLETVLREVDAGRRAALCAVVATRGSTPQPAGAMICVDEAARLTGTLGGGCVEADVRRKAHAMLTAAATTSAADGRAGARGAVLTFALDNDFGYEDGMICGGEMDVAVCVWAPGDPVQPLRDAGHALGDGRGATLTLPVVGPDGVLEYRIRVDAEPRLVIAGAGHISRVLAGLMLPLGFRVHVVDDRGDYACAKRFPPPIETVVGDIASTLEAWPADDNTYFVIVTRGHRHDERALGAVLRLRARYVGMIGSRRKIAVIFDDLRRTGATDDELARVRAPIGLDIHAITTDEIALSIAAELVAVRRAADCVTAIDVDLPPPHGR